MKITPSKRLPRLAEHLAFCHTAAEQGRYEELSECLVLVLGPILSLVNEDFESLEADFLALKAQIDQANADVEYFFTMHDERPR
jgi:hypothetical protein